MTRGGARPGAGRVPVPESERKINYYTRLRPDQVKWLRSLKNAAVVLERLIDDEMKGSDSCHQ